MGKRISTLKRVGLVSLALAMGLLAMPIALTGSAYADEPCDGPHNVEELNAIIYSWNVPSEITLCGDIDGGGISIMGRQLTVNLNGHTITAGQSVALSANNWWNAVGSMTVIGNGVVNGALAGNLSIQGGVYSADPTQFVSEPLAAYQREDGKWTVETKLTADNFVVDPTRKAVRVGSEFTISVTKPNASTTGVAYVSADESVALVSDTGVVTGVGAGQTTINVYPTYDTSLVTRVSVSVYDIVPEDETDEADEVVADSLKEVIDEGGLPKNPHDAPEEAKEVLGEGAEYRHAHEAIRTAMGNGDTITTAIEVDDEYEPTDHEVALVEERLADYDVVEIAYYDVSVIARDSEGEILAYLHKLNERVVVALATTSEPAEGYTRRYLVVHILDGVPYLLTEGEDFYIEDGVLYVITDRFSTFAVAYEDTLVPEPTITVKATVKAPETGANTEAKGSASANVAVAVVGAIAATMVASAVVFAKRK